jgi:hypothetical protein
MIIRCVAKYPDHGGKRGAFDRPADHTVERAVEHLLRTVPASQLGLAVDVIVTLTQLLDEEAEVDE